MRHYDHAKTKKILLRALSLMTASATALITPVLPSLSAFLDGVYYSETQTLLPGLDYSELYYYSETTAENTDGADADAKIKTANQRSFVLTYDPSSDAALPCLSWGEYVYGRETLDDILENDPSIDPSKAAAAVNADFFSFKTGVPLGVMIRDGVLYSDSEKPNALVITSERAYITQPEIKVTVSSSEASGAVSAEIAYVNKYPSKYGAYLLTGDWGKTTASSDVSREIVLRPESEVLALNSNIKATVVKVRSGVKNTDIPDGCFVITMQENGTAYSDPLYSSLKAGDSVEIKISASENISDGTKLVVGGGDLLLSNGVWDESLADETHEKEKNPRTAVGITRDGKVLFYACDGRKSGYSDGLTLSELSQVMAELGCVWAMNLDGGGSTTVMVGGETVNSPTDGNQRAISDAVIFLNALGEDSGLKRSIAVTSDFGAVLAGGGVCQLSSYLRAADYTTGELLPNEGISYEVEPAEYGRVENGTFIASDTAGVVTITAKATLGGESISGTTTLTILPALTKLSLKTDYAAMAPDGTVKLTADGYYRSVKVGVSVSQLKFDSPQSPPDDGAIAVTGVGLLYLDPDNPAGGIIKGPSDTYNTGLECEITASAGEAAASVKLLFGIADNLLEDFESAKKLKENFVPGSYESVDGGRNSNNAVSVKRELAYKTPPDVLPGVRSFTIWAKGDADLSIKLTDKNGAELIIPYERVMELNRAGWSEYRAELSSDVAQPVKIVSAVTVNGDSPATVDNFTAGYGAVWKHFCDMYAHWSFEYVRTAYKMGIIDGYSSQNDSEVYFLPDENLTRAQFAKLLAVYLGLDVNAQSEVVFADESFPEWAVQYVSAVVSAGLMKGKSTSDAGICFDPEGKVTRAEVMQVFGGLLKGETSMPESDGTAGFTDSADIPDWAAENVAKTVAAKIVTGYSDGSLKPNSSVTRAEICAMFVRLDGCAEFLYE